MSRFKSATFKSIFLLRGGFAQLLQYIAQQAGSWRPGFWFSPDVCSFLADESTSQQLTGENLGQREEAKGSVSPNGFGTWLATQAEQNSSSGALRTSAVQKRSGATASGFSIKITW
jgi:hypothetical protein